MPRLPGFSFRSGFKVLGLSLSLQAAGQVNDVKCEVDNSDVCGEIYGLALGFEIADANFNGSLQLGHPLTEIGGNIGDQNTYMLDLRWTL